MALAEPAEDPLRELYGTEIALPVLVHAGALRNALAATHQEEITMSTTKPLRCRLGLHRCDERENPETRERYRICLGCNGHHERPRASPGTASASTTNTGMF